tara:strand:- start:7 stop:837 length:831 start_codon:yes stop_codon:yes gene_type:complete
MHIIKSATEAELYVKEQKSINKNISLIPTMGNLHDGHLELIKKAPIDSFKVLSIYINHLQFDDENDYINYPKSFKKDISLCKQNNIDLVFMPENKFLTNCLDNSIIDLPKFTKYMCGATRKGHFLGVYKIIKVLFDLFSPNYACFGKKDFQQLLLIKYIANTFYPSIKITEVETHRRNDKIAMSSRLNMLGKSSLDKARLIFNSLEEIKIQILSGHKFNDIRSKYKKNLENNGVNVEYLEIRSLQTLEEFEDKIDSAAIFIACKVDGVRLIDNLEI